MEQRFIAYLESLKQISGDPVIDIVAEGYHHIFEGIDSVEEMNEYFPERKNNKIDPTKTLNAIQGQGLKFRRGPGRGTLSYNPEDPMVAAQNANTSGSSATSSP